MAANNLRPPHLADFSKPPLNEVVLGVQFAPPQGYGQIRAGEVWNLFRDRYPLVEEHPPLPPSFETFGPAPFPMPIPFSVVSGAQHDRFWFLSKDKGELIQFQHDRLLHNWRKTPNSSTEYPRFEIMSEKFYSELLEIETYFSALKPQQILYNQAEISYINHIFPSGDESASSWINFVNFDRTQPDDFNISSRDSIISQTGVPYGRLNCEFFSAQSPVGDKMYVLSLSVKGAPYAPSRDAVMDFLKMGREVIISKFVSITTDSAHAFWGRTQ